MKRENPQSTQGVELSPDYWHKHAGTQEIIDELSALKENPEVTILVHYYGDPHEERITGKAEELREKIQDGTITHLLITEKFGSLDHLEKSGTSFLMEDPADRIEKKKKVRALLEEIQQTGFFSEADLKPLIKETY
jgi:hypothetical protein